MCFLRGGLPLCWTRGCSGFPVDTSLYFFMFNNVFNDLVSCFSCNRCNKIENEIICCYWQPLRDSPRDLRFVGEMGTENFKLLCSQPSKDVNTRGCEIPSFRTNHMMSLFSRTINFYDVLKLSFLRCRQFIRAVFRILAKFIHGELVTTFKLTGA